MMLSRATAGRNGRSVVSSSIRISAKGRLKQNVLKPQPLSLQNARFFSPLVCAPTFASSSQIEQHSHQVSFSPLFQHQQVRWKRKGGASAFSKPRPPTRKQRKEYYRRKRKLYMQREGKHSSPGAKAGYRREWTKETFQELLDYNTPDETMEQARLEYDYGDALVDDLMGNTAHYSSLPTPKPIYLGHKHKQYYNRVRRKMDDYRQAIQQVESGDDIESDDHAPTATMPMPPSDHEISLVLRAYRDRNGTKTKPIGIVKALKHLLTDLSLSTALFGEETYTTLLTCCQTPKEARRIFRLQREQQHPISSYSWAILVDIHAKLGDFQGCDSVMKEMVQEGILPSLPAYTSLLAACYKVVNNGTIPHSVRDKAAKLGWNKWKEMIVSGIEPDAMAYGALLRLTGARGQPEKAINILEEMQTMGVKPTTLCFTSALKAVSRSQQTAVRFERGGSKKNRRREQITAHHGKLARKIVILAENAEVEQDDGFVAALMMCAGAAGDSATAKAILLASEVRKMDELRTIGPEEHLKQLRGQRVQRHGGNPQEVKGGLAVEALPGSSIPSEYGQRGGVDAVQARSGDGALAVDSAARGQSYPSFEEREYGTDTRKLSALLFACSQAVDKEGLGLQWAGRYSKGYLCENSLRLLVTRPQPKYFNADIPGVSSTEVGMGSISWQDEEPEHLSKSLRRAKYRGIKQDDSVGQTMEDIDEAFFNMFKDDYKEKMDNDPTIDPMLLNKEEWEALREAKAADALRERRKDKSDEGTSSIEEATFRESDEEWYFDDGERKWKTRKKVIESSVSTIGGSNENAGAEEVSDNHEVSANASGSDGDETELYFDADARQWKTRPKVNEADPTFAEKSLPVSSANATMNTEDDEFQAFFRELKEQIRVAGDEVEFDEDEARELFAITRGDGEDVVSGNEGVAHGATDDFENDEADDDVPPDFESFFADIKDDWGISEDDARAMYDSFSTTDDDNHSSPSVAQEQVMDVNSLPPKPFAKLDPTLASPESATLVGTEQERQLELSPRAPRDLSERPAESSLEMSEMDANPNLAIIQNALPGLPVRRARKVLQMFEKSLNYPSMLELVPILRENMPDHLTSGWLKRRNVRNADVVVNKAEEEGIVDVPIMNGALQVKTSAGSLDDALAYHDEEFAKNGLAPTAYSDRLVLQMLVRNNRMGRALAFKQKVEEDGRNLDVISYGSLIEYYGNHGKLGSAMLVLKECLDTHGAPPGAKSIAKLRLLARQHDMETKLRLEEMIGKDPMEWLRHGEANLKREMSFKGRRDINLARNRMVQG